MEKLLKEVKSSPITGKETLRELLEKSFTAHYARDIKNDILKVYLKIGEIDNDVRKLLDTKLELPELVKSLSLMYADYYRLPRIKRAFELLKIAIEENYTIFLAFAGALTPADFGASCLLPLIERGVVDVITTTGANIYHEMQRAMGGKFYEYDVPLNHILESDGDAELIEEGYSRIYNIIFPEVDLYRLDDFIADNVYQRLDDPFVGKTKRLVIYAFKFLAARSPEHKILSEERILGKATSFIKTAITSTQLHKAVSEVMELKFPRYKNWLVEAKKASIPVFCGAPQDSSLLMTFARSRLKNEAHCYFDIEQDINEMAALQYLAQQEGKFAVIILGGGVPKNFTLQGEPYLQQILGIDVKGFDIDIQIGMADVRDGGLSGCTASEGTTWDKVGGPFIYIKGEVLSIFPLIVYEICRENLKKIPKKLYSRIPEAMELLRKKVKK
ncbi:MAG: hypothetical protein A2909_01380 [Candidatus Tagabacteria bacterium RIFCSPLOWO2_01_FULL_39_11]|uniref:Deoxyhypusine synthase n=1 Tax=Candidatus Tagabacteria bacterium RIFCSPLOWO2_01_FULL_39_11 TaxID=1802295 RepID=A0A1G2LNC1_9BACT|nr:MAG: hypothetical protein A2909_01380 [Candidatus Tagabacteria bacterium RIFCSPLOWO2_01_FULL_39_11]